MKRLICLLLCLLLTVSFTWIPAAAKSADRPEVGTIWEDFSRAKVGKVFSDEEFYCVEPEGSVTCCKTLGALGGVNAARLTYSSLRGYHNIFADQGFHLIYNQPKPLKGISHIVYYVKLPISRADDAGTNWCQSGVAIMQYLGETCYARLADQTKVELLSKNGRKWETFTSFGMYLNLPTGFEGYIKIPVSGLEGEQVGKDKSVYSVYETIMQFSNMGGKCGDGYVNAVYGLSESNGSVTVKLNGEKEARYYTTCATVGEIAKESKLINAAMKGVILQDFSGYEPGYVLNENGLVTYEHKDDVTTKLVKSMGGIFDNPWVEFSSPTVGGFHDVDPFYTIYYPAGAKMDDLKAVIFYIKCAKPHPMQPDTATFRFNLFSERNGEPTWSLLQDGACKYLPVGDNQWHVPTTDDNGIIFLPANFEGYIMADIDQLHQGPIADTLDGRTLRSSTVQYQAVGGESGNGYLAAIYGVTEKAGKRDTLITFNDCDVYQLGTGQFAAPSDLLNSGPGVGTSYDTLPQKTTSAKCAVKSVTDTTAYLEWDAHDTATGYRIDLYTPTTPDSGEMKFMCAQSVTSDGKQTGITVKDLTPCTRYVVQVTALGGGNAELAIYRYQHFLTKSDVGETSVLRPNKKKKTGTVVSAEPGEEEVTEPSGFPVWAIVLIVAVAVAGVGGAGFFFLRKKRKKAEG